MQLIDTVAWGCPLVDSTVRTILTCSCVAPAETLCLPLGPFLLLSGAPHKLQPVVEPQQGLNRGRPLSGNKRGRGKGAAAAAAAVGPSDPAQPAARPVDELVMVKDLASAISPQHFLQLVDSWGNGWSPAAAKLAARLQAAGASRDAAGAGGNGSPDRGYQHDDADDENADIYGSWTKEQREQLMRLAGLQGSAQQEEPAQPPGKRQRKAQGAEAAAVADVEAGTLAAAAAAAAAGGANAGPAAEEQWVLQLLLRKVGASLGAAGNRRQAAAAAAGPDEPDLWHISTLDFDPSGCCTVPEATLSELKIHSTGDWELYGQAVPASASGTSSSSFELDSEAGRWLKLLLGRWHVVSEDSKVLKKREMDIRARIRLYNDRVKDADTDFGKHKAAMTGAKDRLREAEAVLKELQKDLQVRQTKLARQQPPVSLQEQATAAAGQRGLLGRDDRRQRMLEQPWARQTNNRQQTLRSRLCSAQEVRMFLRLLFPVPQISVLVVVFSFFLQSNTASSRCRREHLCPQAEDMLIALLASNRQEGKVPCASVQKQGMYFCQLVDCVVLLVGVMRCRCRMCFPTPCCSCIRSSLQC